MSTVVQAQRSRGPELHEGPCGIRMRCWRRACRDEFGPYHTVELVDMQLVAHCHGARYPLGLALAAELTAHSWEP